MKLVSVNVGRPRLTLWHGVSISTGIYKSPITGRVALRNLNLDGDRQADLSVHGGPDKAVYVYPLEHYTYWQQDLPGVDLPFGAFGENFTTEGLDELRINIGDKFSVGTAKVVVTQPRMPCYKLNAKFQRPDMVKRFLRSQRHGFYLRVLEEGDVGAGDEWQLIDRDDRNITVADIVRLYYRDQNDVETMRRAIEIDVLPTFWKEFFQEQIAKSGTQN